MIGRNGKPFLRSKFEENVAHFDTRDAGLIISVSQSVSQWNTVLIPPNWTVTGFGEGRAQVVNERD